MKNLKRLFILSAATALLFAGCAKDGATGPTGPQGPAGTNGTANIAVETYNVTSWASSASSYYANLNVPELTSTVQSNGTIQAFFSTNSGQTWVAIPVTIYGSLANYWFSVLTQTGLVEIQWWYNGGGLGSDPNTYFSATTQIKVVIIPPAARMSHPNTNWKNYDEVEAIINSQNKQINN